MTDPKTTVAVLLLALLPATSAFASDADDCNQNSDVDRKISGCTRILQHSKEPARNRAVAANNRGNAYSEKDDNDRAIADYNEAIRLDPKYAVAFYDRGTAYRLKNDDDHAIADYNEAIRLDPKYTVAFFSRAYVYRHKGDIEHAIADLDAVIRLDPKHFDALYGRGYAYYAKRDYERAIADYSRAIPLGSKYLLDLLTYRGNAYFGQKDFDRAIADYDAALKIDPKSAGPLYARGLSKKKKGYAGGDADIAAATEIQADIAKQFARDGVK